MNIHQNPDPAAWAKFFIETTKDMDKSVFQDESYMTAWFANAMMAMHDHLAGIVAINGDHLQYLLDQEAESERSS